MATGKVSQGTRALNAKRGSRASAFTKPAAKLIEGTGFAAQSAFSLIAFVEGHLGRGCVRLIPGRSLPGDGALAFYEGQWRIYLRRHVAGHAKNFVLLHEFSHWFLGPNASEDDCDSLASALLDRIHAQHQAVAS